ncbi:MAG: proline--tRNA ligase, partial [Solirubrobacteraceae bacterium]
REFVMKDSYTFDRDAAGLAAAYDRHAAAYDRICDRCGLEWYRVKADVGMMGGHGADEYMAPCAAGENEVALAAGYAANLEVASAEPQPVVLPPAANEPQLVSTPGASTIDALAQLMGLPTGALMKAFPVVVDGGALKLVMVRGDHRVNEIKLANAVGPHRPATPEEIAAQIGPPGFMGPVGARVPVLLDEALVRDGAAGSYVAGANQPDAHQSGVVPGRDFKFETVDVRTVAAGDTVGGSVVRIEPAIEIGNIFKLGTRYSEPLGARYLDENGRSQPIWMGSYGFGPARAAAAAVEQYADEQGIAWPRSIAPFDAQLVVVAKPGTPERELADRLYDELQSAGLQTLYDERDAGPGEKFADAELLGCPLRVTVGRRTLAAGEIEVQVRRGRESRTVPVQGAAAAVAALWRELP